MPDACLLCSRRRPLIRGLCRSKCYPRAWNHSLLDVVALPRPTHAERGRMGGRGHKGGRAVGLAEPEPLTAEEVEIAERIAAARAERKQSRREVA